MHCARALMRRCVASPRQSLQRVSSSCAAAAAAVPLSSRNGVRAVATHKVVITLDANQLPPNAAPVRVPSALLQPFLSVLRRRAPARRRRETSREQISLDISKQCPSTSAGEMPSESPLMLRGLRSSPAETDAWLLAESPALNQLPGIYWQLAKGRLTVLVGATCVAGFCMAPAACFDPVAFLCSTVGVTLMSTAANTFNQILEVPYDAQMRRTQARPLVLSRVSPLHAAALGTFCTFSGAAVLYAASTQAALLGLVNVLLYAGVYTPMKRHSIGCTWVGAAVGAIPPLMGWAAAGGDILSPGAAALAGVLFSWQFPHFNALSWNLRPDYTKAGYRVMCVTDPGLCRRTTIRHSVALLGLCSLAAPLSELTSWHFALDSLPLNAFLIYLSARFYKEADAKSSRSLFRYTLLYLPLLMMLLVVDRRARRTTVVKEKIEGGVAEGHH